MADIFDTFQKFEQGTEPQVENVETPQSIDTPLGEDQTEIQSQETPQVEAEIKTDEFIDNFNKRFGTQYKADDDIKGLFGLPQRLTEYEEKVKEYESLKKSNEQYKVDLDSLQRAEAEKYLSSPLMQKAYVADQLVKKYPRADIGTLTDLAMADLSGMSDIDILTKEQKMKLPNMSLDAIKSAILSEVGIDPVTDPNEWDEVAKVKLAMRAANARENIGNMVGGVELPKIETKEETQKRITEETEKRIKSSTPFKAEYSKYDKYKIKEGLDYTVPDEFKSKLPDMFDAFIIKAGNEPTPDNLAVLNEMRDSVFFSEYRDKIYETMYKDAESKVRAEIEKELHNDKPINTTTASDKANEPNLGRTGEDFLNTLRSGQRAKRI